MAKQPLLVPSETPDAERKQRADEYLWEEHDASYIPGYAEHVKANDLNQSRRLSRDVKESLFRRWGAGPRELPIEFVWLRETNAAGGVSHSAAVDRMDYVRAGFKRCLKDDYTQLMERYPDILWGVPWEEGSATLDPDGAIRRLDSTLWVVETNNPRYQAWQRRRAEERSRFDITDDPDLPYGYARVEEAGNFEADVVER